MTEKYPVRPHLRRGHPVRFQLRRYRTIEPPDLREAIIRRRASAYVDPKDPYVVNLLRKPTNRRNVESVLNHELLHIVMNDIGEREGANALDRVAYGRNMGPHGFAETRIPESELARGLRAALRMPRHPTEVSRFDRPRPEA